VGSLLLGLLGSSPLLYHLDGGHSSRRHGVYGHGGLLGLADAADVVGHDGNCCKLQANLSALFCTDLRAFWANGPGFRTDGGSASANGQQGQQAQRSE
jgi:hypothetical protein